MNRIRPRLPSRVDPDQPRDESESNDGPPGNVVEEGDEDRLDDGDPQHETNAPGTEPAAGAAGVVFERVAGLHGAQPYHAGAVTQTWPRGSRTSAAARASRSRTKSP